MKVQSKRIKLLEIKPYKVKIQYLADGKIIELAKKRFEKWLEIGLYELTNPEALPKFM